MSFKKGIVATALSFMMMFDGAEACWNECVEKCMDDNSHAGSTW